MSVGNGYLVDLTVAAMRPTSGRVRRFTGKLFMAIGLGLLCLSAAFLGYVQYTNRQLAQIVANEPSGALTEVLSLQPQGSLVPTKPLLPAQRIAIPSIGLDSKVIDLGTRVESGQLVWETPAHAVGWYRTTALPGQSSNIVMSGHISSPLRGEGSIFRRLPEVTVGDIVVLETDAGQHRYRVVSRAIVSPTAVSVMAPTPTETLTLITCYPDLIYSHRLVVQAQPLEG